MDRLAYRDEVYDEVKQAVGDDSLLLYVGRYGKGPIAKKLPRPGEQTVALVHGHGSIRLGRSGRSPLGGGSSMGSDTVCAALRAARRDEHVKAVVFRVDSPGGSYVASDAIWREVVLTRRAGKPIVVSMGDLAASGGYMVSMAADAIVAQPGTLTGSIGVFGGKAVIGGLLEKLGVTSETVGEGANSAMFSPTNGFSEAQWARINAWLDRVYDDFVNKVAEGRSLTRERAHELAKGRVWTGADAQAGGLVDELGGLEDALALARRKAASPPTPRCASTPSSTRWSGCARRSPARTGPPPWPGSVWRPGVRSPTWPPSSVCRPTARSCSPAPGPFARTN